MGLNKPGNNLTHGPRHGNKSKSIKLLIFVDFLQKRGKSKLQVPDTGTRVLGNTRPFLRSSIVSF